MNFLSTGNQWTEIDYLGAKTTMIVGLNGAGKSTSTDSLTYALYGKAYRNINLPQLVNSITNKGLLVEIEFSIGNKQYLVQRGMKPAVFKIFVDGEEVKSRGPKDDQKYLEETILKMNINVFKQVVVISSTAYKPFMTLAAADRRKVVDSLLDAEVITVMGSLLKTKVDASNEELKEVERQIDMFDTKISLEKKRITDLQDNNDVLITEKEERIETFNAKIEEHRLALIFLQRAVDEAMADCPSVDKASSRRNKLLQLEASIEEKKRSLRNEITFFENHDDCPTCKQSIDLEFKECEVVKKKSKATELDDALSLLEEEMSIVTENMNLIAEYNKEITRLNNEIQKANQEIRFSNGYITDLNNEIQSLRAKISTFKNEDSAIEDLTNELKTFNKERKRLADDKAVMTVASKLLKDTGIKTKIVNKYIPVMNQLINANLAKFDLFVEFTLDENFNETIKSRHRDVFTYASFSEGEKMRIDLSILFAWRSLAKLRNSASTNLLFMDEVFDGASDFNGVDALVEVIQNANSSENIIMISHSDKYNDSFDRVLKFEKNGNFSRMIEE